MYWSNTEDAPFGPPPVITLDKVKLKFIVPERANTNVIPIMSFNSYNMDTKFGKAKDFIDEIEEITGNKIIHTIKDAEPIGPKKMTDVMVVAPCSRKYNWLVT